MTPDGTLIIRNLEKKDGGVYGCLASNQAGTDTMTSILTYIGECHRAHPSIHPLAVFAYPRGLWEVGHTLCSPNAFSCAIANKKMFCLLYNNSLSVESPVVTVALSDILIGIGETTVMACSATGTPQPEIWWYKGNILEVEGNKTKHIKNPGWPHATVGLISRWCPAAFFIPLGRGHVRRNTDHQGDSGCWCWSLQLCSCQCCWHLVRRDLSRCRRWEWLNFVKPRQYDT